MFTIARLSGRNSAPAGRVTKMPSPTATMVLATAAAKTVSRCAQVSASRLDWV